MIIPKERDQIKEESYAGKCDLFLRPLSLQGKSPADRAVDPVISLSENK